jgi:hypothetical protein
MGEVGNRTPRLQYPHRASRALHARAVPCNEAISLALLQHKKQNKKHTNKAKAATAKAKAKVAKPACDQPRDQPGKCLYYDAHAFWLYLQSHCRLRNGSLVCGVGVCFYTCKRILDTQQWPWPWCDLGGEKKSGSRCAWQWQWPWPCAGLCAVRAHKTRHARPRLGIRLAF